MSALMDWMLEREMDAEQINNAMSALQENGLISDLCLTPGDVYESDAVKAVEWLRMADRIMMDSTGKYARISVPIAALTINGPYPVTRCHEL